MTTTKEREKKVVEKCLWRRLAWCNKDGHSYDTGMEQDSVYPLAIAESNGVPYKGSKARTWTEKLRQRYSYK